MKTRNQGLSTYLAFLVTLLVFPISLAAQPSSPPSTPPATPPSAPPPLVTFVANTGCPVGGFSCWAPQDGSGAPGDGHGCFLPPGNEGRCDTRCRNISSTSPRAPYCFARMSLYEAYPTEMMTGTMFAAAGFACLFMSVSPDFSVGCKVIALAVTGAELGIAKAQADKNVQGMSEMLVPSITGVVVSGAGLIADAVAKAVMKSAANRATLMQVTGAIVAATLLGVSVFKTVNGSKFCGLAVDNCKEIMKLSSWNNPFLKGKSLAALDLLYGLFESQSCYSLDSKESQATANDSTTTESLSVSLNQASATMSPEMKDFVSKIQLDGADELLNRKGLSTEVLRQKLAQNSIKDVILEGLPDLPDEYKEMVSEVTDLVISGKVAFADSSNPTLSGKLTEPKPLAQAQSNTEPTGRDSQDLGAKSTSPSVIDSKDIWHSSYTGSIFQIISNKLREVSVR